MSDADKIEEVELHLAGPAKNFLIWFTKAAPDGEGSFDVEISDVKLVE